MQYHTSYPVQNTAVRVCQQASDVGDWCPGLSVAQLARHAFAFLRSVTRDHLGAVSTNITVLWNMTPCSLVGRYQHFGVTSSLLFVCMRQLGVCRAL
jgi:hypothetical protein